MSIQYKFISSTATKYWLIKLILVWLYSHHLYLSHHDLNFDQRNILYWLSAIEQLNINQLLLISFYTKYCLRKLCIWKSPPITVDLYGCANNIWMWISACIVSNPISDPSYPLKAQDKTYICRGLVEGKLSCTIINKSHFFSLNSAINLHFFKNLQG